jgi:hypothetical protein
MIQSARLMTECALTPVFPDPSFPQFSLCYQYRTCPVCSPPYFNDAVTYLGPVALGGGNASLDDYSYGFRVVSVPEPGALALLIAAALPGVLLLPGRRRLY